MPQGRPAIPKDLQRALLVEAGHRCANRFCGATCTEFAHIVPWRQVQKHEFQNMIALCPTCHTRFDKGEIDRQAVSWYKRQLGDSPVAGSDRWLIYHSAEPEMMMEDVIKRSESGAIIGANVTWPDGHVAPHNVLVTRSWALAA